MLNLLEKTCITQKSSFLKRREKYTNMRNTVNRAVNISKNNHYGNVTILNRDDPKILWRKINGLVQKRNHQTVICLVRLRQKINTLVLLGDKFTWTKCHHLLFHFNIYWYLALYIEIYKILMAIALMVFWNWILNYSKYLHMWFVGLSIIHMISRWVVRLSQVTGNWLE